MTRAIVRALAAVIMLSAAAVRAEARLVRMPGDIIERDGVLNVTDGVSVYTFRKDGAFSSVPAGMSGPAIEGRWTNGAGGGLQFVIEGRWYWLNGLSRGDDFRTMKMWIPPLSDQTEETSGFVKGRIYRSAFAIDDITEAPRRSQFPWNLQHQTENPPHEDFRQDFKSL